MKQLLIIRKTKTDGQGLFGTAFAYPSEDNISIAVHTWNSGELNWVDKDADGVRDGGVSCIKPGEYIAKYTKSPKRSTPGNDVFVYQLEGVEGAFAIQLHSANFFGDKTRGFVAQVEGCIGLGKGRAKLMTKEGIEQEAITDSKTAIKEFMDWANKEDIKVKITEQFPGAGV